MELESPVATPATPPPVVEPPVDLSIADHEAQYGPGKETTPVVEAERPRHRAKSQQASAEDVPRIAELTKKLREAERRAEEAERRATSRPEATERRTQPETPRKTESPTSTFSEKEPTLEDFSDAPDPYLALTRASAKWDRKKEAWDAEQLTASTKAEDAAKAEEAKWQADAKTHGERTQTFAQAHPDFEAVTKEVRERHLPGVLLAAIVRSDNSPELVYHLAQHPDDLDELYLLADGKVPSDESVAILQRRLHKLHTSAAPIASALVVPPHPPAPRPPNAMKTAPMKMGDDPPAQAESIDSHRKWHQPKGR